MLHISNDSSQEKQNNNLFKLSHEHGVSTIDISQTEHLRLHYMYIHISIHEIIALL